MQHVYLYDLPKLKDILDTLEFEDEPSIFTAEYAVEIVETALHLMDEYIISHPQIISEPDFHEILLEEIKDIFYIQMEDHIEIEDLDFIEDDMNELLEDAFEIFITTFYPERSINTDNYKNELNNEEKKICNMRLFYDFIFFMFYF